MQSKMKWEFLTDFRVRPQGKSRKLFSKAILRIFLSFGSCCSHIFVFPFSISSSWMPLTQIPPSQFPILCIFVFPEPSSAGCYCQQQKVDLWMSTQKNVNLFNLVKKFHFISWLRPILYFLCAYCWHTIEFIVTSAQQNF